MLHFKLPLTLKVLIPIQAFFVLRVFALAPKGEWDSFNYAPKSKTVYPVAIHSQQGSVTDASHLVGSGGGKATLLTSGSWVALDFGVEVRIHFHLHILHATRLTNPFSSLTTAL